MNQIISLRDKVHIAHADLVPLASSFIPNRHPKEACNQMHCRGIHEMMIPTVEIKKRKEKPQHICHLFCYLCVHVHMHACYRMCFCDAYAYIVSIHIPNRPTWNTLAYRRFTMNKPAENHPFHEESHRIEASSRSL